MGFKYGDNVYICSPHAISLNRGNNLSDGANQLFWCLSIKLRLECFVLLLLHNINSIARL